jgi:tRNA (guanine37-N1)-methyltransferase
MKFQIITLFPDYFHQSLKQSLVGKAWEKKLFDIDIVNLRDYANDRHRTVDDTPFGGGGGMVLKVEPLDACLQALGYTHAVAGESRNDTERIILTSAAGTPFDQQRAIRYSLCDRLTIVCGHYLGADERIGHLYDLDEVSIGDYVLTGGEPAAAVIVDAVARLFPKVLGNFESALGDSYMNDMVGAPCYTRPAEYAGRQVPQVLLSGDHARKKEFRRTEAVRKCRQNRPDLLDRADIAPEEPQLTKENNKAD